jgi:hypothetical protein
MVTFEQAKDALRTLKAYGLEPESFSCSIETMRMIENEAITASIVNVHEIRGLATVDSLKRYPMAFGGVPINVRTPS